MLALAVFLRQGMTPQSSEKLASATGSYPGTTSVVPFGVEKYVRALASERISQKPDRDFFSSLFRRAG
jgi:hypothetical protein